MGHTNQRCGVCGEPPFASAAGVLSILLLASGLLAQQAPPPRVAVEFVVTVPAGTPEDAAVYLAGSVPELGAWRSDGIKLTRRPEGTFAHSIQVPRGARIEFKVTRGTWQSVEKSEAGQEIGNRTLTANRTQRVDVRVAKWADDGTAAAASPAAPPTEAKAHTLIGTIRTLDDFESKILDNRRMIWVYLPPNYDEQIARRYPVLYMHDGQNCFDDATSFAGEWKADETAQRLIADRKIRPIIIVAIANAGVERVAEYTPTVDGRLQDGGKGDRYARFVMSEVKPFIDNTYRTLPERGHTAVCGSSLGGVISLHLARTYPDRIGLCAAVSPSLWWDDKQIIASIEKDSAWTANCRIWLDMGTAEAAEDASGVNVENTRRLVNVLESAGRKAGVDFKYVEVPDGQHNEPAWAARFEQILLYLFPPEQEE